MAGLGIRIAIEVALAAVLSFSSVGFWQVVKGRRYGKRLAQDQEFLDNFTQRLNSDKPFSERTSGLQMIRDSWAFNMLLVTKSELQALGMLRNLNLVVCLAILAGSFFLGIVYLAVNIFLFMFWALTGLSAAAQNNTLKMLLSMAQILYCWRRDDKDGYEAFLEDAVGVRKLASSVERYAA